MARRTRRSPAPSSSLPSPASPESRRGWIALIVAAAVVKLIVLAQLHAHPLLQPRGDLDTSYYVELASRVAAGDVNLGGEPFFVSPLYVYVLGVAFAVFGANLLAAQLVQVTGGVVAVGLIAWTARQWFGATAGWVAGGLAMLTGLFTFNEIAILQSSVDPLLTSLWIAALTRATGDRRAVWWVGTGALLALHALNRPNVLLCAVVLVCAVPFVWRWRVGLVRAAACAAGVAAVIGAVVLRNAASFGEPLLITAHGGLNFYIGNHAGADGTYSEVPGITPSIRGQVRDARRLAEGAQANSHPPGGRSSGGSRPEERLAAGRLPDERLPEQRLPEQRLSEGEVSGYFYGLAFEWISSHPADALGLFVRKVAYTLNATDLALNHSYTFFSRDESSLLRVLVVGPWCLVPLGVIGLALALVPGNRLLREGVSVRSFVPVALMTPAFAISVAIFFVSGRYRLPLLVPLTIASAPVLLMAYQWLASRGASSTREGTAAAAAGFGSRSKPVALVAFVTFLALVALANWSWGLDDGRAEARTDLTVALIETGDDAAAERWLELTAVTHPAPGLLHYRAARAWHARGALDRAIAAYRRARAADSDQPEIAFNLGEALVASGAARDAVPHLQAACDRGVRPVRCTALLAKTLADLGARDEAARRLAGLQVPAETTAGELSTLGSLALSLGQLDAAERWLREALARQPQAAANHEQYGLVLMLTQRPREAAAAFERASQLDPSSASAAYNLAVAHLELRDRAAAHRWLDEALRRQPDYAAARRLRVEIGGR